LGGSYDGSTPDNIIPFNMSVSTNTSTTYYWSSSTPTTTGSTIVLNSNAASGATVLQYSLLVEVVRGSLYSITDNKDTTPNSITFDY
jgi:hypothetical protein